MNTMKVEAQPSRPLTSLSQGLQTLKTKFIAALPFVCFFAVLFFTTYSLFGPADALMGIIFLFFAHTVINEPGLSFGNYLSRLFWLVLVGVVATLAGLHPIALVLITPLYMLAITILNSDDYLPRNSFWLGMGYLILLIYPVDVAGIGLRMAGLVVSLVMTTLFVYGMKTFRSRRNQGNVIVRDRTFVKDAFEDIGLVLARLATLPTHIPTATPNAIDPMNVFRIAQAYAKTEYSTVFRQNGILSGRQSYTFALLLCCEQIADMAHAAAAHPERLTDSERAYFRDLSRIFLDYVDNRILRGTEFIHALERFLQDHRLPNTCHEEAWNGVLEAMLRILCDHKMAKDNRTNFWKGLRYRFRSLRENVSLKNTQTRFAIRLSILVGLSMIINVVLTYSIDLQFGIWIPISAFATLNTYNDETIKSSIEHMWGTILGLLFFALFVHFIPSPFLMPVVIILGYLVILMDLGGLVATIAITQTTLTALYPSAELVGSIVTRLALVIIAVTCVVMIILLFMRTKRTTTIHLKIREMERIDTRLAHHIHQGSKQGHADLWRSVQLLYYMHMNAELLESTANWLRTSKRDSTAIRKQSVASRLNNERLYKEVKRVLHMNYKFAMDAEHAVMLLDPRRLEKPGYDTDSWINPDSTNRIEHIDATNERLDEKMHELEKMRYLEDDSFLR